MFENTKLSPCFNGYQYLFIFISAVLVDLIIHCALKTGTDAFGFAPGLMFYYRSLSKKGPFSIDGGSESFYSSCNSWLMGAFIAGISAVILLLITDLFLYGFEARSNLIQT
jgi:hypothetical protein